MRENFVSLVDVRALVLEGGNADWRTDVQSLEAGKVHLALPHVDRFRRPWEGTDAPMEAMQAYRQVAQLGII